MRVVVGNISAVGFGRPEFFRVFSGGRGVGMASNVEEQTIKPEMYQMIQI